MTYFLKSGTRYHVSTQAALDLHDSLPLGTYTVKFDQMAGEFYLESIEDFEVKGKVYGDSKKNSTRILSTFLDRSGSTGVMLCGEKGSGKTLLAKLLSLDAQEIGIPTIVINQPWCGETFNGFMQMIEQPTVVIFDEFEKVYNKEEQEKMLTLLDGVYPSKKLFVITCNDRWRIDEHMKNRPGRIFYRLDYKGLEDDFIVEYCEDNLLDKTQTESVCRVALMFSDFNFDILKGMVEEMNRYGESAAEVLKILNAKPEHDGAALFDIKLSKSGEKVEGYNDQWKGNPLGSSVGIYYKDGTQDSDGDDNFDQVVFQLGDLTKIDAHSGEFVFVNKAGWKLALTKVKAPEVDLTSLVL